MKKVTENYWEVFGFHLANSVKLSEITIALDIGTGWGDCLIPLAKRIGSNGELYGIDINVKCVHKARSELMKHSITNARVELMNASELKFENNFFDVIICGFLGFDDYFDFENNNIYKDQNNLIMKELYRVLKPKGRIAFSSWKFQEDFEIVAEMTQNTLKSLGYSKENEQGFQLLMQDAGFKDIQIELTDYQRVYESIEDFWKNNAVISINKIAHNLDNESYLAKFEHNGKFYFRKTVLYAKGKK
ncbi:class I SAM-dependent methyltransferase [Promethearchaeum syntrophicum]|uniref:Class I SAM-dependent methyltransferase n=1 Tax=Promethearchaeum syntrophicum TaxID=2594042 RepID=A0A5B9D817_9ARCH|nr:class I SAM-dependent methyltransferase [Candidatus Prometheoarchaeum syntrophicum]QEE15203.1 arsenite S-adenosylmethyltransferase [Candidatus Prometheoarchaeum syntrophicum]